MSGRELALLGAEGLFDEVERRDAEGQGCGDSGAGGSRGEVFFGDDSGDGEAWDMPGVEAVGDSADPEQRTCGEYSGDGCRWSCGEEKAGA